MTAALIAAASALIFSVTWLGVSAVLRSNRPHLTVGKTPAARPPRVTSADPSGAPGLPKSRYPLRRHGQATLQAGDRIDLDVTAGGPWPIGGDGGWPPYDLEFTESQRLLVGVGTETTGASLAWIKHPANTYNDCMTQDYGVVVPTSAIVPGTEICVLTGQRRRVLGTILAVKPDPVTGLPAAVTLTFTEWDHIVPPGG